MRKLPGVSRANVGLLAESGDVVYDPSVIDPDDIVKCINSAGFTAHEAAPQSDNTLALAIGNLGGTEDAMRIEHCLKALAGVRDVTVDADEGKANVDFDANVIGARDLIGYEATWRAVCSCG